MICIRSGMLCTRLRSVSVISRLCQGCQSLPGDTPMLPVMVLNCPFGLALFSQPLHKNAVEGMVKHCNACLVSSSAGRTSSEVDRAAAWQPEHVLYCRTPWPLICGTLLSSHVRYAISPVAIQRCAAKMGANLVVWSARYPRIYLSLKSCLALPWCYHSARSEDMTQGHVPTSSACLIDGHMIAYSSSHLFSAMATAVSAASLVPSFLGCGMWCSRAGTMVASGYSAPSCTHHTLQVDSQVSAHTS